MWWPVMNPLPNALPSPSYKVQLIYLVVLIFAHNPFSSVFSFSTGLIYPWYERTSQAIGVSALQDQQLAGVIMGVVYMTVMLIAIGTVFVRWFSGNGERHQELAGDVGLEVAHD